MGEPKLYLRGHDVEEFHGVVQRYGASPDVQKMVELANDGPTISRANIAHAWQYVFIKVGLIFLPVLLYVAVQRGEHGSIIRACKNIYSSVCMP